MGCARGCYSNVTNLFDDRAVYSKRLIAPLRNNVALALRKPADYRYRTPHQTIGFRLEFTNSREPSKGISIKCVYSPGSRLVANDRRKRRGKVSSSYAS